MEWYKQLKKGDFVVSLTDFDERQRLKGTILQLVSDPDNYGFIYKSIHTGSSSSSKYEDFRPATQQEKELYLAYGKPVHIDTPMPEHLLLVIARDKYPTGTEYVSVTTSTSCTNIVKSTLIYYDKLDQITDGFGGSVYKSGKWAEIMNCSKHNNTPEISQPFLQEYPLTPDDGWSGHIHGCESMSPSFKSGIDYWRSPNSSDLKDLEQRCVVGIDPYKPIKKHPLLLGEFEPIKTQIQTEVVINKLI